MNLRDTVQSDESGRGHNPAWDGPNYGFSALSAQTWRAEAICRGRDRDLFFPLSGEPAKAKAAKAICAQCPVRQSCLEDGIEEPDGIRGGMDATERRQLQRKNRWSSDYRRAAAE